MCVVCLCALKTVLLGTPCLVGIPGKDAQWVLEMSDPRWEGFPQHWLLCPEVNGFLAAKQLRLVTIRLIMGVGSSVLPLLIWAFGEGDVLVQESGRKGRKNLNKERILTKSRPYLEQNLLKMRPTKSELFWLLPLL